MHNSGRYEGTRIIAQPDEGDGPASPDNGCYLRVTALGIAYSLGYTSLGPRPKRRPCCTVLKS